MTTDRIHPARPAAPTDRPAQQSEGNGFAALLEVHAGPAHAPRRDEAARPDASCDAAARNDAARDDAAGAVAQHDAPRGETGESRSDTASGPTSAVAAPAQLGAVPVLDEARPSLIGLPVLATAPAQPAATAVPAPSAAIVVPAVVADSVPAAVAPATPGTAVPSLPAAGQPVAAAPQVVEGSRGAPAPAAPVAGPAASLDAAGPAAPAPAPLTPAPAAATTPVAAHVEGEAPVAAPVVAAQAPEPAAVSPQAPAPVAEPAHVEPHAAPTTSVGQPAPAAPAATTSAPERAVPLHRAPAAVATLLHVAAERGVTHARMALRPAELGGIEIRLQVTAAGVAAQVVADSPEAARLLAQAGDDLRRALEVREVALLSLEVSTSSEERSRESARGDWTADPAGPGAQRAATDTDVDAPVTQSVLELPGGLLVDVLA